MEEFFAGLAGLLVALIIIPLVLLVVVFAMAAAGLGVAVGLIGALIGVAIELFVLFSPVILGGVIVYFLFRGSRARA